MVIAKYNIHYTIHRASYKEYTQYKHSRDSDTVNDSRIMLLWFLDIYLAVLDHLAYFLGWLAFNETADRLAIGKLAHKEPTRSREPP